MITVDSVSVPKSEVDWTDAEEQASIGNGRAINAIFNGMDLNVFKLINSCSTAKEVRRILEVAYEGTFKVKISRLQLITSKFEALKMSEDEWVSEYNERVLEIANESLLLGEKIFPQSFIGLLHRSHYLDTQIKGKIQKKYIFVMASCYRNLNSNALSRHHAEKTRTSFVNLNH